MTYLEETYYIFPRLKLENCQQMNCGVLVRFPKLKGKTEQKKVDEHTSKSLIVPLQNISLYYRNDNKLFVCSLLEYIDDISRFRARFIEI